MAEIEETSRLLTFPPEIRLEIFSLVMGPPYPFPIWIRTDYTSESIHRSPDVIALFQLEQPMADEAKNIFYGNHIFGITNREDSEMQKSEPIGLRGSMPSIVGFRHFLSQFPAEDLGFIARLEMTVEIAEQFSLVPLAVENDDDDSEDEWKRHSQWRGKHRTAAGKKNNAALRVLVGAIESKFKGLKKIKLCVHDGYFDTSVTVAPGSDNFETFKKCFGVLLGADKLEEVEIETGGNMDLLLIDVLKNSPFVQQPTVGPPLRSGFFHYHLKRSSRAG